MYLNWKELCGVGLTGLHELWSMIRASGEMFLGMGSSFGYHGLNPACVRGKATGEAILLLHGDAHNQSGFLGLARRLKEACHHPVYTLNLCTETGPSKIRKRIREIREHHLKAGVADLEIHLVGHSSGAILAAEYAVGEPVEGTRVGKLISIAGRLRPKKSWFPVFYRHLMGRISRTYNLLATSGPQLYSIAAGRDWLVPHESVAVAAPSRHLTVPNRSHLSVLHSRQTHDQIIEWLQ